MRVISSLFLIVLVVWLVAAVANAYSFSSFPSKKGNIVNNNNNMKDPVPSNLPKFCNGINCPSFTTVATCNTSAGAFSIRKYPSYQWVTWATSGTQLDYDSVGSTAFHHLFEYISGQNANSEKIDMTAPVTTSILSGAGPNCKSFFNVSFFIPYKFQGKAPTPSGTGVFLSYTPEMTVAVEEFPGYADKWASEVVPRAKALAAQVTAAGITPLFNDREIVSQYDSPFRFFDRHNPSGLSEVNEIWFQIPSDSTCSGGN